jgi:hypothetical protein
MAANITKERKLGTQGGNTHRGDDEFPSEQAYSWESTVSNKWQGCKWVDCGVDICNSFQTFEASTIPIPKRTMPAQTNFH